MRRRRPPRFTVLLPTHNRADVVGLAIRSVLTQSVTDLELLVVGDGCSDATADVVRSFDDRRLTWFDLPKAPNHGYANRNVALARARGELLAYQAHDDLWLPDHLERLGACLDDEGAVLAYSRPLWVTPAGGLIPLSFNLLDRNTRTEFLLRRRNAIPAACVVYRRSCHDRVAQWDDRLADCGDWDLWARIIDAYGPAGLAVLTTPTCLHFRARWRTDLNEGPPELAAWKGGNAAPELVASSLGIDVAAHLTEQAAYAAAIASGGPRWVAQMRSAVALALDRRVEGADRLLAAAAGHERRREAELWELRRRLNQLGDEPIAVTDELAFGPGFYGEEGGWRWMGAEGQIEILCRGVPAMLWLDLACGPADAYKELPFVVQIDVDGVPMAPVTFAAGGERVRVGIPLWRPLSHIALHSEATFVRRRGGYRGDMRELAVCVVGVHVERIS